MRTEYDLEMLREIGFCNGIENYSRHLSKRKLSTPWCLIDFFPMISYFLWMKVMSRYHRLEACITVITQEKRLVDFGFRLPSALDNRPLKPDEFEEVTKQTIYVSATPANFEMETSSIVVEQLIRPTGLLDPIMESVQLRDK